MPEQNPADILNKIIEDRMMEKEKMEKREQDHPVLAPEQDSSLASEENESIDDIYEGEDALNDINPNQDQEDAIRDVEERQIDWEDDEEIRIMRKKGGER